MTIDLAIHDVTLLEQCESRIEKGIDAFLEVGDALLTIRDKRLYRATHPTFELYCQERWSIERRRAYQLISAARVIRNVQDDLSVNRGTHSPVTERQLRPLTGLEPAAQRTIWAQVIQENPDGDITGAKVQEIVDRVTGNGDAGYIEDTDDLEDTEDTEEFRAYEREVLLPRLHDAGLSGAPQILSGQHEAFQPVPDERQEEAGESLRQSIVNILALCREGHTIDECADELLDIMGQSSKSISLAVHFGIALSAGPQTLSDLTSLAAQVCGTTASGEDYLKWHKRAKRLVDSLTYSGCGIFEHTLENGQLVYALAREL